MKCRCSNCGWLEVNPGGAMFCGYSDERTWENESCLAWKDKDEPQTNYDRIISKTPEELAMYLAERGVSPDCVGKCHADYEKFGALQTFCEDCWAEYLKQEATE